MRSSRSTHAILSLPHKYRVPLRRKRSLGYARDDDTRERAISHGFSSDHVEGCPCGAVYPPPSAHPFFKGLHNSHVKTLTLRKVSSPISSFRAQREIFLAQQSNGERQMRSSRSTHAILSLPHKYRVPLRRKRSLGYARDDDMRERAISHSLSFLHVEGCPFGADLSSAFGAPLLQGATPLTCKSATPKRHSLPDGKVNEMRIPLSPVSSFRAKREIFLAHRSSDEREMRSST